MKLFFFALFLVLSLMYPPYALLPQSEGISLSTKQQQIIDNMMQDNKNPQPSQINDNTLPQNQSIQQLLDNIYGKIHIINPQSYPTVGGYWTVNFTSIGTFDLIVTSINGTSFGAYPDDVTFVSLHDSNANNITSELVSDGIKFSNFHSDGVSSFTVLVNTAGKHHLKFEFGGNVAFANNSAITANPFKIASGTNGGPTLVNNDYFGTSIANIGDLNGDGINDVAVGAYSDDTGGADRGAVHILFMNVDGTVKSSPAPVKIASGTNGGPTLADSDYFGWSVANIGDINSDGISDIAVGAAYDATGGASRGAVHILFMNADGTVKSLPSPVKIASGTNGGPTLVNNDYFGSSVANIGDLNGDGINDIAVGSSYDDTNGTNRGAIYILLSTSITPSRVGTITPTAGINQVALSWSAAKNIGSSITDYTIRYSTNNIAWTTFADGISTGTTATVTGISAGLYYFRVAAINSAGTGPYSNSVSATPIGAPSQISTRAATVTDSAVLLRWTAPNQGGAPITDYNIYHSLNNSTWTKFVDGTSTATSATVTGLTNGVLSYFKISAVNSNGAATNSTVFTATPVASSSLISSVTAVAGVKQTTLSWTATNPTITDYTIEYSTDGTSWDTFDDEESAEKTVTVTGLNSGVNYMFRVTPVTECPQTVSPIAISTSLTGVPGIISKVFALPENNSMRLEWKEPDTGGASVSDYIIQKSTDGITYSTFNDGTSTNKFTTVTGLTNAQNYYFKVAATNSAGTGLYSAPIQMAPKSITIVNSIQTYNSVNTFQSGTSFVDNQSFVATQTFAEYQNFGDGTAFVTNQAFSGVQNFGSNQTFGAGTSFTAGQEFSGVQTFGTGTAFGTNTKFDAGQSFANTVSFATGTTFANNVAFANNQVFSNNYDFKIDKARFGSGTTFSTATVFGRESSFTGHQNFVGSNTFYSDTVFGANQNFAAAQKFGGNSTFGAGTVFAANQVFKSDYDLNKSNLKFGASTKFCNAETFGANANFTGTQNFIAGNTFGTNTVFPPAQTFSNTQTFGANNVFGTGTAFNHAFNFGSTDLDFTKTSLEFDKAQNFGKARIFGSGANFTGVQTFVGNNTFTTGARFDVGQTFSNQQIFGSNSRFADAVSFTAGQDFTNSVIFDNGFGREEMAGKALNFTGDVSFPVSTFIPPGTVFGGTFDRTDMVGKKIKFDDGVSFDNTPRAFPFGTEFAPGFGKEEMLGKAMTFEAGAYFGDAVTFPTGQRIAPGVMFKNPPTLESGVIVNAGLALPANTIFSSGVQLPTGTVPPYGILLEPFTCTDANCVPPASAYLAPGELIPPGTNPAPTVASITSTNSTVSIPGLGFSMTFNSVTSDGTISVDLLDPASVTGAVQSGTGRLVMSASNGNTLNTVGSIMEISVNATSGAATSGGMSVTLPYDEANLGGIAETDLKMLHYVNGAWITEDNCTTNTTSNSITCTVTSLSPFGIGSSTAPPSSPSSFSGEGGGGGGGGGGGNCDENGFGKDNSLRVYQVSYDVNTFEVKVQASSSCGKFLVKIATSTGVDYMNKSPNQPLLDDDILIYSGFIDKSDKKFSILIENALNSFTETFDISDKSMLKDYDGYTGYDKNSGYTSSQQGTTIILQEYSKLANTESIEPIVESVVEPVVIVEPVVETPVTESITEKATASKDGGGCLIATATYGTELAPQVQQLRELRDNQLLQTQSGSAFMGTFNDVYYTFSPTVADWERESPIFKEAVKLAITPMISTLSLMENANSESEVLSIGIFLIMLNLVMYVGIPAIVIIGIKKRF